MQPQFQQAQQSAVDRYRELAHTEQASSDLREIVPAAYYGQVDTLFVAVDWQQWGAFDPDTNTIQLYNEAKLGADDLLDAAAIQTLLHDGTIYAVAREQMPDQAPVAAIFRYKPLP